MAVAFRREAAIPARTTNGLLFPVVPQRCDLRQFLGFFTICRIVHFSAQIKMSLPPTRPLGQTLVLCAVVIGTMALGAVILWAATHWLWLVVHQGLH